MAGEDYFRKVGYPTAMEPDFYNRPLQDPNDYKNIEQPIFPVERLGVTVPEVDQSGKARNLIEGVQGAIRRGAGTIQIVMTQPHTSEVGARFKAIGHEVRRAIKEVAMASGAKLQGLELPTSLNNVTGWDGRTGFNETVRRKNLEEVRDGIKFAADIGSGGGVDVLSWEFPRAVNFVQEIDDKNSKFGKYWQDGIAKDSEVVYYFVDKETGLVKEKVSKDEKFTVPFDLPKTPEDAKAQYEYLTGSLKDPEKKKEFDTMIIQNAKAGKSGNTWEFKDVEVFAQKLREIGIVGNDKRTEDVFLQIERAKKIQSHMTGYAQSMRDTDIIEQRKNEAAPEQKPMYEQMKIDLYRSAMDHKREAERLQEETKKLERYDSYGKKKAAESYAELAIAALKESKRHPDQPEIYVGPEIGWPDYYGSHPDEFKELVLQAREEFTKKINTDDNYASLRPNVKELAEKHIKGLFDTSHMGMWFQHFDVKNNDYKSRVDKFNEWYTEKVKDLAKSKVIGDIQLVDTLSGAHSHLPAGEGFLPLKETLKIFKENGYEGDIISEGHEEDKFGDNRIQLSAWKTAGVNLGEGYEVNTPRPLSMPMRSSYFGRTYSPLYIMGSYIPSNEVKLWSEVPLE